MALSHPLVKAGLAISGVYDLGPIRDTVLNVALKLTDKEVAELSPLQLPGLRPRKRRDEQQKATHVDKRDKQNDFNKLHQ